MSSRHAASILMTCLLGALALPAGPRAACRGAAAAAGTPRAALFAAGCPRWRGWPTPSRSGPCSWPATKLPPAASRWPRAAPAAFVYDNALAGIALIACGQAQRARRIGDAMLQAGAQDRFYHDARLRNAYRAGPVPAGPVPCPVGGTSHPVRWFEDAYQTGTATGNVAWAALLLLALHQPRAIRAISMARPP